MFDYVDYKMPCPSCGKELKQFQTKDKHCVFEHYGPWEVDNFYTSCPCGEWIEFNKKGSQEVFEEKRVISPEPEGWLENYELKKE